MPTIKDIAKLAGVSITTVSKVINNYPDIGQKTRKKVLRIMKEQNYRPNAIARSLSTNRSYSIGVFINYNMSRGLHQEFFHDIIFGLETTLGKQGYDFVNFSELKWKKSCNYLENCRNRHVDGAVLMGIPGLDDNLDALLKSEVPCVFIDFDIVGPRTSYVTCNNVNGANQAVDYLAELGHTRIATIMGLKNTRPAQERFLGYRQGLQNNNLDYNEEWVIDTYFSEKGGYTAMKQLLAADKAPEAVFCQSDVIAIGAINAIKDVGLNVPADFSIIGFDDILVSKYISPPLTTIKQDTYLMGQKTAELLLEFIEGNNNHVLPVILPTELIVRDSCQENNNN